MADKKGSLSDRAKAKSEMDDIRKAAKKVSGAADKAGATFERAAALSGKQKEAPKQVYEVQSGDSLSKIALDLYGDASRWPEIFEANKDTIKDPNLIRVGQKLNIP